MKPPPSPRAARGRRPVVDSSPRPQGPRPVPAPSPPPAPSTPSVRDSDSSIGNPLALVGSETPPHSASSEPGSAEGADWQLLERLEQRQDSIRWQFFRRLGMAAGGVSAVALGLYLVFFSQLLALDLAGECSVEGAATVPEAVYCQSLQQFSGQPLPRLSSADMESVLYKAIPQIKRVQVSKAYLHGVLISVEERKPLAACKVGGKLVGVDADGVTLERSGQELASLPTLDLDLEKLAGTKSAAVRSALAVLDAMSTQLKSLTQTVGVDSTGQVVLNMKDGAKVLWGDPNNPRAKSEVTLLLIEQKHPRNIDVSSPQEPSIW